MDFCIFCYILYLGGTIIPYRNDMDRVGLITERFSYRDSNNKNFEQQYIYYYSGSKSFPMFFLLSKLELYDRYTLK